MNRLTHYNTGSSPPGALSRKGLTMAAATVLLAGSMAVIHAAEAKHPKIAPYQGGIAPQPTVTSISRNGTNVTVGWHTFAHQGTSSNVTYQLVQSAALNGTNTVWTPVATVTNSTTLTTAIDGTLGFLALQQDPAPSYRGAESCLNCHENTHNGWLVTRHAQAFETLKRIKQDNNATCLPCHTVGYGTPNGFKDEITTPHLAGVQCESCHGPAQGHVRKLLNVDDEVDETRLPLKTLAAEMCGGCHTDAHHPTYDEWKTSLHGSGLVAEEEFADPVSGPGRMPTCGACHSGATRLALLKEVQRMKTHGITDLSKFSPVLPSTHEAAETGITCIACHDPHAQTEHDGQLLFPMASKIPYSYTTATNFAANFNPNVQLCAQCHNMRGASWRGTSRPPHHSPQYNLLIGSGGFDGGETSIPQSAHMDIETQCAQCHTHPHSPDEITEATPAFMGHDFHPSMKACAPCHDEVGGELLTEVVQGHVKKQIGEIKALLDQWALTKAPEALRTKYGRLAWEFQNVGQLSLPTPPDVRQGPTAAEQANVPDAIKQARHNIYMVEHDGSYGVHNGNYSRFILKVARDLVNAALAAE